MPSVQTTQTTEVKLSPKLKTKILLKLRKFQELRDEINLAKGKQNEIKEAIEIAFIDAGEFNALQAGVSMEGFIMRHGGSTRAKFDKLGAVKRGWLTIAQIAELTTNKPTKASISIRCPGEKDDE